MIWLLFIAALVAGAAIPVQAGINSQLTRWTGHAVMSTLISFSIGTLALLAHTVAIRLPWPAVSTLSQAPWWAWAGGLLGAFFVAAATALAPKLGASVLFALLIGGQMLASLALDHYGLIGFSRHPLNLWRILGAVLLVIGVTLIRRF